MDEIIVAGFPITGEVNLRQTFRHKDVSFEVTNHGRTSFEGFDRSRGTWCYYVYVNELMMNAQEFAEFWLAPQGEYAKGHVGYGYSDARWAYAVWHCGVTWYSKVSGFDGEPRGVKIGCDYAHYWDEGGYYNLNIVKQDAIDTIEALPKMYTFYRRDPYNGVWLPVEQMTEHKGNLYSPEGLAATLKLDEERSAVMAKDGPNE
jgi:hypothetical protein